MPRKLNVGLIQMRMTADPQENREKAVALIRDAGKQGAEIICLPELFTTPYFCALEHSDQQAPEPLHGPTAAMLSAAARDAGAIVIGGSFQEETSAGNYNTATVFSETGEMIGFYRKMHIPHDPSFYEQHYFLRGDTGYRIFRTSRATIGVLICYDQWFPEAARAVALAGADIIFYPTAIGLVEAIPQQEGDWQQAWETVQRGHAVANGVVVAAVNRVGKEDLLQFWGGSFICDAFGKVVGRGGSDEELLVREVDLDHGIEVRRGWRFFENRRPETYGAITHPITFPGTGPGKQSDNL